MGRPAYQPTPESREIVRALTGFGIRQPEIAEYLGITHRTLRKYYKKEFEIGVTKANAAVAKTLFEMATQDRNVSAAIFWLKARAGWKERYDHSSEDGSMTPKPTVIELVGPNGQGES